MTKVLPLAMFGNLMLFFGGLGTSTMAVFCAAAAPGGEALTKQTPVTLALAVAGIILAFTMAWKIQGYLKDIVHRLDDQENRLGRLEKSSEDEEG